MKSAPPADPERSPFDRIFRVFERAVLGALMVMMGLLVVISAAELGWHILENLRAHPILLIDADALLELFGFFLLVLIGIELLETIKAYLRDNVIHVEVVLEVALIAVARKVIVLDPGKYDGLRMVAVALLVLALAAAFWMERRARR